MFGHQALLPVPDLDRTDFFLIIGRRQLRAMNWWTHNYPGLMKGKIRCTAWMNPLDAEKRSINENDIISVLTLFGLQSSGD
ncbi:MAG: molybdopterin dinucleotide binding domain-containing protein [Dissulfuribacterales bacterium]